MAGAAAIAGAAVAQARRRVISHFMSRNAVSPESAVPFDADRRIERRYFEEMREAGVIATAPNGRFYLDLPRYDALQVEYRKRQKWALFGVVVALVIGVVVGVLGSHR